MRHCDVLALPPQDLEDGLWAGSEKVNPLNTPITTEFVTAMVKGGSNGFALKGADATTGALKSMYDGPRPRGYQPMKKQGSIILGIGGEARAPRAGGALLLRGLTQGLTALSHSPHTCYAGDNSNRAIGTWYEGCITAGYTTDATDSAVQVRACARDRRTKDALCATRRRLCHASAAGTRCASAPHPPPLRCASPLLPPTTGL